jgi:hypothetical protein
MLAEHFDREFKSFRLKVRAFRGYVFMGRVWLSGSQLSTRMTGLAASWQSAKVVRTREKVSFFFGVMNLVISALMFGMAPQYVIFSVHTWTEIYVI